MAKPGRDGERVDQIDVHDIEEERHLPEHREHTREPASRMLEGGEQHQGRAERHHQIEQRRRIFLAIEEGQHGRQPSRLHGPRRGIAIEIAGAEQDETERDRRAQPEQQALPRFRLKLHHRAERIARGHHPDPRHQRIEHEHADAIAEMHDARLMQDMPERLRPAPNCSARIPSSRLWPAIMASATRRDRPARQPDERRQRDHRDADHPDHARGELLEGPEIEGPAEAARW